MILFYYYKTFIIYKEVKDVDNNDIIKEYNNISKELLKMDLSELNKGIWNLLIKFKSTKFDLTNIGFKQFYTVMQHILNFGGQELFCIN